MLLKHGKSFIEYMCTKKRASLCVNFSWFQLLKIVLIKVQIYICRQWKSLPMFIDKTITTLSFRHFGLYFFVRTLGCTFAWSRLIGLVPSSFTHERLGFHILLPCPYLPSPITPGTLVYLYLCIPILISPCAVSSLHQNFPHLSSKLDLTRLTLFYQC